MAELTADARRQHLPYTKNLPSPFSVDIQTSFGYMMPSKSIIQGWWFLLFQRKILSVGLTTPLSGNEDWDSKNAFKKFPAIRFWERMRIWSCFWKAITSRSMWVLYPTIRCKGADIAFGWQIKHKRLGNAHERSGLIASIGQTLTGQRFHETDEWFGRQKNYLDNLESQLKGSVKTIELAAKQRAGEYLLLSRLW